MPALWFLPPSQDQDTEGIEKFVKLETEWLEKQTPTRTIRLVALARALDKATTACPELVARFRKDFPGDPGADLAVISLAMTSIDPRLAEPTLAVIEDAAKKLYASFRDPFMLYVQGLVCRARGNEAAGDKLFLQANAEGFVAMGMLRFPFEKGIEKQDKILTLAALRQISKYWSRVQLDKSKDAELRIKQEWRVAQESVERKNQIANGKADDNRNAGPFGRFDRRGVGGARRNELQEPFLPPNQANTPPGSSANSVKPDTTSHSGEFGGMGMGSGRLRGEGFSPPTFPSKGAELVHFIILSKGKFDANAVTSKLRERLRTGNFQMSYSGNETRITLGFQGSIDEAIDAVDFGTVVKKNLETRTITIEARESDPN